MHWAAEYIGKPWVSGGQGPESFDCWGLVRYVMRQRCGVALPIVDADATRVSQVMRCFRDGSYVGWEKVDDPQELDGVLMSHAKHTHHVGVWVDTMGGGVLHCVNGAGVVFMDRLHLRLSGWNIISFWRHECKPV